MYYPYFRSKQYDLLALSTLLAGDLLSAKICPIIEAVKFTPALDKVLLLAKKKQRTIYLIQNPQTGAFSTKNGRQLLAEKEAAKAYILDDYLESLPVNAELLLTQQAHSVSQKNWQDKQTKVVVPLEFRLIQQLKGPLILSQDSFTRLAKNEHYRLIPDEDFSTDHLTYQKRDFVGFSDFSIDSRIYYEKSYPSAILSLHMVYFADSKLRIHHFLSPEGTGSQREKFLQMMEEVMAWQHRLCGSQVTLGYELLVQKALQERFPGNGVMRKASVMHHLELMGRYLDGH